MARVKVIEPRTGSVIEVDSDSPMAQWKSAEQPKTTAKKSTSSKSSK